MSIADRFGPGDLRRFARAAPGVDLDRVSLRVLPTLAGRLASDMAGITFGRTIWVTTERLAGDPERFADLIVHELVHVAQWRRLGAVGFLARYVGDYLLLRARGHSHRAAYRRIPAEIEARTAEGTDRPLRSGEEPSSGRH